MAKKLDLKWLKATSDILDYDNFISYEDIFKFAPEILEFKSLEGKEYKSNTRENLQSNLDRYSIIENGEYPDKNIKRVWTLLVKQKGKTSYKLNSNFEEQFKNLKKENGEDLKESEKQLKIYVERTNPKPDPLTLNEKVVLVDSERKRLYIKKRDGKFVRRAKEMFFEQSNGACEQCGYSFEDKVGYKYIELHHIKPFSTTGENKKIYNDISELRKDFEFLCSNCHTAKHL